MRKANTALDIRSVKTNLHSHQSSGLENGVTVSLEKEKITLNDLKRWPEQEQLAEGIEEITDCYRETKHELKLWHQRYKKLAQLFSDMKSINSSSSILKKSMSSSIYTRQPSANQEELSPSAALSTCSSPYNSNSPSRSPGKPKFQSSQSFSENLMLQLSQHPDLRVAFLPLVGRESTLLPPTSTVAECAREVFLSCPTL